VAALGYGHPRWLAALERQAREVVFQSNAVPMEVRARAARKLVEFAGLGLDTVFFVNSGAEANENALRIACSITGRGQVVAVEARFHGRTAAAAAVTWGRRQVVRLPARALRRQLRAAPRQRRPGALRSRRHRRSDRRARAGRRPAPSTWARSTSRRCAGLRRDLRLADLRRGAVRHGPHRPAVRRIEPLRRGAGHAHHAKALGGGFPVGALLLAPHVARHLKINDLGTTFGGGPLACAVVEAVIDAISSERLLDNVRALRADRETCITSARSPGPGRGLPARAALLAAGARGAGRAARARHPGRHQRDPHGVRLLPPYTPRPSTWTSWPRRSRSIATDGMKDFLDLADLTASRSSRPAALARRLQDHPEPQALAGKVLALLFLSPSLRTLSSFQAAMARSAAAPS
jgi:hypothetical protein